MHGKLAAIGLMAALGASALGLPAPAAAAPGQPHLNNIVQRAQSAGRFTTFTALVKRAGLSDMLSGRGPYTVFAPTDAAFRRLPETTLTALAADKAKLRAVLLHHVVKGSVPASELLTRTSEKTLDGGTTIRIAVSGAAVRVGGGTLVAPGRQTSNGIFYAIDRVLDPDQLGSELRSTGERGDEPIDERRERRAVLGAVIGVQLGDRERAHARIAQDGGQRGERGVLARGRCCARCSPRAARR